MEQDLAISVSGLTKTYGDVKAVRGIDFHVARGEVFGLLGPNGAGKTTTVEILEGLRPRTSGEVKILGFDPENETMAVKDRIGVCLQATVMREKITVEESLELFGAFYSRCADQPALLKRLQLWEKRKAQYKTLSGGQKQRLAIALAMVNEPDIVFLDEPTTGLDPQIRREIHALIEELRDRKTTIVLTTHYIEEAERLCDRVAIVDEGRIVAHGTPRDLQERIIGKSRVEIVCENPLPEGLPPNWPQDDQITFDDERISLAAATENPARAVVDLVKWVDACGCGLSDIHIKRPTLEDVFIQLTGKTLRD